MAESFSEKINYLENELLEIERKFGLKEKKKELKELEEKSARPDFWQKEKEASIISQKLSKIKESIAGLEKIKEELLDLKNFLAIIKSNSPEGKELAEKIAVLERTIFKKSQKTIFSGKYDLYSAIIDFQAGAGGNDSEDWTAMLFRMYQRWAEAKNFQTKIIHQKFGEGGGPEGRIGLKEASLEIKGKFAYGFLKKETGVHRLVRISPFSAKNLRHTSFARIEVYPFIGEDSISELKINPDDLRVETFRASGPGGQYVNRRESAVRITHLPTGIKAESQEERLQGLNRKVAMKMLASKIAVLKEKERKKEIEEIKSSAIGKGKSIIPEFGNQIRSYILHPYKLVKDHRTEVQTSQVEAVLDGEIDEFIEEEVKF